MLSIIILSYNTREVLAQCLDNLSAIKIELPHEILVIDNASSDGSPQLVEERHPDVILIQNSMNKLYAGGCNQGASIARGEYLLFLNSDALPGKGQLEILYTDLLSAKEDVACLGPRVVNADGTLQSEGHPFETISLTLANMFAIIKWPVSGNIKHRLLPAGYHRFRYGIRREVEWVSGCCMLIRKIAWAKTGPFDEKLYFYNEDTEWCYRARQHGYKIGVVPEACVVHLGGVSSREPANVQKRMGLLSGEKHFYQCTQGYLYHLFNQGLILGLYPFPYLVCKLAGLKFYQNAAKRHMSKAFNTIKIILNKSI